MVRISAKHQSAPKADEVRTGAEMYTSAPIGTCPNLVIGGSQKGEQNRPAPAQRAVAIKRRKEIWEALHPTGGTNCSTGRNPDGRFAEGQKQFAAETAAISRQSKQGINRHLARAEALGDDLQAVAGTSLDKGGHHGVHS